MKVLVIFSILSGIIFSGFVVTEAYGSVVEINFDDMVHQSDLIVIGTVAEIAPTFEAGTFGAPKDQFFYDVTLDIDMTLFKDVSFTEVSFRIQKDRALDGHTSGISTSQDFEVGERVLVFLTKSIDNDYWDGQYHVLGNHQGKYSLLDGQAFGLHFNEISEKELVSKIYETKQKNKIPKHSLDSSFTLPHNQTALVADQLYVTFSRVTQDSRCPSDVTCIWQGKASIQLDLRDGKYHAQKILSVGDDPDSIVFDTYKIELLDVKPKPVSTKQIIESDYTITALVTKSGFIPSPLKQIQNGISPVMVQCDGLVLIHKYDGSPACVKLDTKTKLMERGWTHNQENKSIEKQTKITGNTALQICSILSIPCPSDPAFDALQNPYAEEIIMDYSVGMHEYDFTITSSKICYTIDGLKDRYCEPRKTEKPKELDGNKQTLLSKSVKEWKDIPKEELNKYYEKYPNHFYTELGKFLVKHEMKLELQKNNITNVYDDFTVYSGTMLTSNPPHISFQAVINGTDGNNYLLRGGSYANTASVSSLQKLAFHDTTKELPINPSYENLQTITILPENGTNSKVDPYSVVVYLDKNNSVRFYNTLSEPIRIQEDKGNPSWKTQLIEPNQTFTVTFDRTGYYDWDARFLPAPFDDWWKPHAGGEISAISNETQNLDFGKKLKIAGTIIRNSEIPWSGMGTGNNEGLRLTFSPAIFEMLPDAKEYYTARANQLIPFDMPIIIQD